ncbi:MAG: sugar/nucleoside kinase (ribokinase family) [Limisphaerales bacterium]|jgi:sugar/nucleoside kinase (ribokinase family)
MSVLVVGSTALDSIKTPKAENPRLLGGSASHAAVAASFFAPVNLVGVVGKDFPKRYINLYEDHKIDLEGLQRLDGKTFHWSGEYEVNMNNRRTLATELGVFEHFTPHLPDKYKAAKYVLLANIAPALQHHVLDQARKPKFVIADTMDLWLNIALDDLVGLIKRVDCFVLNDSEAEQLTGDGNVFTALKKIHKLGPKYVIIKLGSHGSILSGPKGHFICPAFPLEKVVDPTGAGDSFVGGLIGYLANAGGSVDANIRKAMVHGSVVASFCCEGFGLKKSTKTTKTLINQRVKLLEKMTKF